MGDTKKCTQCGQVKLVGEFARRAISADQLDSACKSCRKSAKAAYYSKLRGRSLEEVLAARPIEKSCKDCSLVKPAAQFSVDKNKPDGLDSYCLTCKATRVRGYRSKDPERTRQIQRASYRKNYATTRAYRLLTNFNLTPQQYASMLAAQNGRCAICRHPETSTGRYGKIKGLAVDHDWSCCPGVRSCGACVRELLCQRCNQGAGHFDHDPARLRAAADYLEKHTWQKPLDHTA